jgi:hypothetical protein
MTATATLLLSSTGKQALGGVRAAGGAQAGRGMIAQGWAVAVRFGQATQDVSALKIGGHR